MDSSRSHNLRWAGIFVFAVVAMGLLIAAVVINVAGFSVVDQLGASSARGDCRSAIAGAYNELRDVRENTKAQVIQTLVDDLLNHRTTPDEVLVVQNRQLAAALKAVDDLPPIEKAVDHGITINGKRYKACPTV